MENLKEQECKYAETLNKMYLESSYELAQILDASYAIGSMSNLKNDINDIEELRDFLVGLFTFWRESAGVEGIFANTEEEGYFTPFAQRIVRDKGHIPFNLTK